MIKGGFGIRRRYVASDSQSRCETGSSLLELKFLQPHGFTESTK